MRAPEDLAARALQLILSDAEQIERLIRVQLDNLTMPHCPLYEEVLDTQMFGLSREINFAVRLGLISKEQGRQILDHLEKELTELYNAHERRSSEARLGSG
ncbi:YlaN family protein [Hydrogenibacillus schlegelii]|uniref:UPF0358 protein HSCHL_2395 n=1 Tax=Hydrogenibacillus schlegelii TaxID=1484 RepID=A0A132NAU3_HYDSH|nr:YlaN family protein [Hydrogenibacillus schlegelii]KWX07204.1 hypothetical protein TR75_03655 [Hydrogenibacillus schlegelii]MBT9281566.1 YlaN family protein [Hydrogenibacillus schlegelii]OAR03901.1 hypothetical protein SA87_03475 [Hydrogenibacillus schlegelii]PTQ54804.1 MAG: hypothetical protein HSCHL_2395 [Hydrogenibacillus schlegelii]